MVKRFIVVEWSCKAKEKRNLESGSSDLEPYPVANQTKQKTKTAKIKRMMKHSSLLWQGCPRRPEELFNIFFLFLKQTQVITRHNKKGVRQYIILGLSMNAFLGFLSSSCVIKTQSPSSATHQPDFIKKCLLKKQISQLLLGTLFGTFLPFLVKKKKENIHI